MYRLQRTEPSPLVGLPLQCDKLSDGLNSESSSVGAPERLKRIAAWAVLVVCYATIYFPAIGHDFVWDDRATILTNPIYQGPILDGLVATQMDLLGKEINQLSGSEVAHDSYRPLLFLSHRLDIELFGFDARALHTTNILTGFAAVVALFLFANLWLGSWWQAFFVSAIFALHPVQVEAIAYISARSDVLATLFIFLATAAALRQRNSTGSRRVGWSIVALVCFLASLLSKESLVGWPIALTFIFWSRTGLKGQWKFVACTVAVLIGYLVLRVQIAGTGTGGGLTQSLIALPGIWLEAIRIAFYPLDLSTERLRDSAYTPYGWGALLLLLVVGAATIRKQSSAWTQTVRFILAGLAWTFLMIGPSALVIVLHGALCDRYLFPPLAGVAVATVSASSYLLRTRPRLGKIALGVVAIFTAMGIVISAIQVGFWKNNRKLYARAVEMAPNSSMAFYRLGYSFAAERQSEKAIPLFEQALELDPLNERARSNLGVSYLALGDLQKAKFLFTQVVAHDPTYYRAWYNLGLVEIQLGNNKAGCEALDRALGINSNYPAARNLKAAACFSSENPKQ